jgi:hypothetical protein
MVKIFFRKQFPIWKSHPGHSWQPLHIFGGYRKLYKLPPDLLGLVNLRLLMVLDISQHKVLKLLDLSLVPPWDIWN